MTLEKAIEIKIAEQQATLRPHDDPLFIADQLGIKAMELVDNLRFEGSPYYPNLLEGETED